ncbi:uncharacterized protein F5147DRAFT_767279 [Suillus discolor]|uniref:Uncharacterized protein n=1 Tax=Suillus discolor TaxID=1912936 RepID=A0A9P7K0J0_9AGAM|nr:uncharacterized protein F5147DRAFT_767279 [Suillus discolor]KAG2119809.1 hypothetical protein F5147DRAFT_767279 [Suillus discolor]
MAPHLEHGKTIDYGMKLASLMSAPIVNDVPTLDKLTALELNHLILHESPSQQNDNTTDLPELSYMLSQIFKSFTFELPDVTELQVPLQKIRYQDDRLHRKFATTGENNLIYLYDKDQCQWNWPLPKSHHDQVKQWLLTSDGSLGDGKEQDTMPASMESGSGLGGSLPVSDSLPLEEEEEEESAPSPPFEGVFMMFFNVIRFALAQKVPKIIQETNPVPRLWSAGNATRPVKDEEVAQKPDLVLLDDVEA